MTHPALKIWGVTRASKSRNRFLQALEGSATRYHLLAAAVQRSASGGLYFSYTRDSAYQRLHGSRTRARRLRGARWIGAIDRFLSDLN